MLRPLAIHSILETILQVDGDLQAEGSSSSRSGAPHTALLVLAASATVYARATLPLRRTENGSGSSSSTGSMPAKSRAPGLMVPYASSSSTSALPLEGDERVRCLAAVSTLAWRDETERVRTAVAVAGGSVSSGPSAAQGQSSANVSSPLVTGTTITASSSPTSPAAVRVVAAQSHRRGRSFTRKANGGDTLSPTPAQLGMTPAIPTPPLSRAGEAGSPVLSPEGITAGDDLMMLPGLRMRVEDLKLDGTAQDEEHEESSTARQTRDGGVAPLLLECELGRVLILPLLSPPRKSRRRSSLALATAAELTSPPSVPEEGQDNAVDEPIQEEDDEDEDPSTPPPPVHVLLVLNADKDEATEAAASAEGKVNGASTHDDELWAAMYGRARACATLMTPSLAGVGLA